MSYTKEQVWANFAAARQRMLPAKLADSQASGFRITAYFKEKGLEPTADNFYRVISNALLRELPWEIKPAKLLMIEANERPLKQQSNVQVSDEIHRKNLAAEAKQKQDEENAYYEKLVGETIAGYVFVDRQGRKVYSKTETFQRALSVTANQMRKQGSLPKAIYERMSADKAAREAADEAARERI